MLVTILIIVGLLTAISLLLIKITLQLEKIKDVLAMDENSSIIVREEIPKIGIEAKLSSLGRTKDSNADIDRAINSKLASSSDKVWEEDGLSEEELEAWSQN